MNKVDKLVEVHLINAPQLFRNRFEVLSSILTFRWGVYAWAADGTVINNRPPMFNLGQPPDPLPAWIYLQEKHALAAGRRMQNDNASRQLDYDEQVVRVEQELRNFEFLVSHREVMSRTYADLTTSLSILNWLRTLQYVGFRPDWLINRRPEKIDEDWRQAIRGWLLKLREEAARLSLRSHRKDSQADPPDQQSVFLAQLLAWIDGHLSAVTTVEELNQHVDELQRLVAAMEAEAYE